MIDLLQYLAAWVVLIIAHVMYAFALVFFFFAPIKAVREDSGKWAAIGFSSYLIVDSETLVAFLLAYWGL